MKMNIKVIMENNNSKTLFAENYPLSRIDFDFVIAPYERLLIKSRVEDIKRAIMSNKLYDNRIIVNEIDDRNRTWEVMDGQHRLAALKSLFEEGKLKSYNIILQIEKGDGKEAYLNVNKGKPLNLRDVLKVANHNLPFFVELSNVCSDYGSKKKLPYAVVLQSWCWAKGKVEVNKGDIIRYAENIRLSEALDIAFSVGNIIEIAGGDVGNTFFRSVILAPLLRIYCNYYAGSNISSYINFANKIFNDNWIREQAALHSRASRELKTLIYEYMKKKLPKSVENKQQG